MDNNEVERRKCPAHCSDSRDGLKEDVVEIKAANVKMWDAIGKKVSYVIFFSIISICLTIIMGSLGYMFARQNTNFDQHNSLASKEELQTVKIELMTGQNRSKDEIISEIRDIKRDRR